jgi:hypothetical protein
MKTSKLCKVNPVLRRSLIFLLLMSMSSTINSGVTRGQNSKELKYIQGCLLVKLKENTVRSSQFGIRVDSQNNVLTGFSSLNSLNIKLNVIEFKKAYKEVKNKELGRQIGVHRWYVIKVPTESDIEAIVSQYKSDPNVEEVSLNWEFFHTVVPNDPMY